MFYFVGFKVNPNLVCKFAKNKCDYGKTDQTILSIINVEQKQNFWFWILLMKKIKKCFKKINSKNNLNFNINLYNLSTK
jgi:hypothetical protein